MQQYIQTLEGRILSLEHQQTALRSDLQRAIRNMPQSSKPGRHQTFYFKWKCWNLTTGIYQRCNKKS